jgi:hypothetical protein
LELILIPAQQGPGKKVQHAVVRQASANDTPEACIRLVHSAHSGILTNHDVHAPMRSSEPWGQAGQHTLDLLPAVTLHFFPAPTQFSTSSNVIMQPQSAHTTVKSHRPWARRLANSCSSGWRASTVQGPRGSRPCDRPQEQKRDGIRISLTILKFSTSVSFRPFECSPL